MEHKIHRLLELDPFHYEEIVLKTFIDWVTAITVSNKAIQLALLSRPIQNYFFRHYRDLEEEFKQLLNGYEDLDKVIKNEFYADITNKIYNHYPSALLPQVKSKEKYLSNQN